MKKTIVMTFLLFMVFILAAVTPEQILESNSVMAYILEGKVYLMDVNTGKEVKVKTATDSEGLLWDSYGNNLYRFSYNYVEDSIPAKAHIYLYEIKLPKLEDTLLGDFTFDNADSSMITMGWGEDGRIYFLKNEINTEQFNAPAKPGIVCGYYSLQGRVYLPAAEEDTKYVYVDKLHRKRGFDDYNIEQILVQDKVNGDHFELFAIPTDSNDNYYQLTKYHNSEMFGISHLHSYPVDYLISENGKMMLCSYHYYINDKNSDYCQTFLTWLDEFSSEHKQTTLYIQRAGTEGYIPVNVSEISVQISEMIGSVIGLNQNYWFEWTSDNKVVYCREASNGDDKMTICTMGNLPVEKVLKSYKGSESAFLYYRSKK